MSTTQLQLTSSHKIAYSAGNISVNLISQTFNTYIVFFYVDHLGVKPSLISLAMVIHGLFNAVMNPFIGYLSDRTRTRLGRRIPYIAFGMIPLAAVFTMIWVPLGHGGSLFWYFLWIVLLYDILFVVVVLNWTSLFPEMFSTLKDRSYVSAWRQMLGIVGTILGVVVPPLLYSGIGWTKMGVIFGVICVIVLAISLYGSKENKNVDSNRYSFLEALRYTFINKSFVTFVLGSFFVQFTFVLIPAVLPFFAKYVLKIADSQSSILLGGIFVTAIPMVYVWSAIANKFGPRFAVMTATALFAFALVPFLFIHSLLTATLATAGIGFCLAGIIVMLDVLLAEVIDEDEKRSGARREGMYFGMNGFVVRWGVSLQAIIMGAILSNSGYVQSAASQPSSVATGIRLMLSGIPIASLVLAFICFYLYPISTQNANVKKDDSFSS